MAVAFIRETVEAHITKARAEHNAQQQMHRATHKLSVVKPAASE
jgi:hypothetical protein